ncbi:MAG: hypothetical protein HKN92_09620 [Chitinophagales bacterium]|nr:hypothetical protein [Chitinophagales bacterium]
MKKYISSFLFLCLLFSINACKDDSSFRKNPNGTFKCGSYDFTINSNGSFLINHVADTDDPRSYTVSGTQSNNLQFSDDFNETSYGHLDLIVESITLNGSIGDSLEITDLYYGKDIYIGSSMLGWWKWTGLVSQCGKMQIRLNVPATGLRSADPFAGSDWLIIGDPQ